MSILDLSSFNTQTLESVARQARDRHKNHNTTSVPITRTEFASWGLGSKTNELWEALQPVPAIAWDPLITAVLAERRALTHPVPELVWTGASTKQSRDTGVVLHDLFGTAQSHILVSIYSHQGGKKLMNALATAKLRGVAVDIYLNIKQEGGKRQLTQDDITNTINTFYNDWGTTVPSPNLYYDHRALEGKAFLDMHAKCIVIDQKTCFIGSANFTDRAINYNIEAGVILHDPIFSNQVIGEFNAGPFTRWEHGYKNESTT